MNALLAAFLAVTAVTSAEKGNLHDDERVVTSVDESKLVHWGEDAVGKSFRVTGGYGSGASSTGGVELVGSTLKVSGSAVYPGVIDMSPKVGGSSVGAFQKFGGGAGLYFYGADDMNLPGHYGLGAGWESLDQRIRRLAPAFSEADPVFAEWSRTNTLVKAETDPRFTRWAETNTFVKAETDPAFTGWIGDELEGTNVFRSKTDLVVYDGTPQSPTEDRLATRRWVTDNASPADYSNVSNAAMSARHVTNLTVYSVGELADWYSLNLGLSDPLRWNEANGRWEDVLWHGEYWLRYDGSGQWTVHIPDGEGVDFKYSGLESDLELEGEFGRFWRDGIYADPTPTDDRLAKMSDLDESIATQVGDYAAVSNAAMWASNEVAGISIPVIDATDMTFSNAVLAVHIDTNLVTQIGELNEWLGEYGGSGATTVGGLLAALLAAMAWLKKNAVTNGKKDDGSPADPKLADFFTESNSLLTGRVNTLIDAKVGDVNAVLAAALDGTEVA